MHPILKNLKPDSLTAALGNGADVKGHIGSGGQGTIFRAVWPAAAGQPPTEIALKIYDPQSEKERITREVQALDSLESDSIARPLYQGDVKLQGTEFAYVGWQFVDGASLRHRVDPGNLLSHRDVARLGVEMSTLLAKLWERRVVHRDIKPDNIMQHNTTGVFVLVDFGLARFVDRSAVTGPGAHQIGTPPYMPPEQYRGDRSLTVLTDVFALGVTMCELLVGSHPTNWDVIELHKGSFSAERIPGGPAYCPLLQRMIAPAPEVRPLPDELLQEFSKHA
jgi:serine/threonine-protein kinase